MTKRKDGRWQESITVEELGRPKRVFFYGHTKAEVLRKIADFRQVQESGRTFAAVAEEWWQSAEGGIAPTTAKSYRPAKVRAVDYFGESRIRTLRPADIHRFMNEFVRTNAPAQKTARNQLSVLSQIFAYAVRQGDCDANIVRDISIQRGLKSTKRSTPSEDDVERIKQCYDLPFGMFAYWLLYTGMRRGELLALTWEDVDIQDRIIHVNKSVYYINTVPHLKAPKTTNGVRDIPIPLKLLDKLKPSLNLVFPGSNGKLMPEYEVRRKWDAYCKASGVNCTPHQLRHLYATALFEAGVDELDAQDLMGHADIATTKRIYTHIRDERRRLTYDKLITIDP